MPEHSLHLCSLNFLGLDSDLSLYVLIILCLVWISAVRNMPLSWSWSVYIKAATIAACAIFGLTNGPKWLFAILGWSCFAILYVLPIILFKRFSQSILELNGKQLLASAAWLRFFNWGKQGEFLYDTAKSLHFYLDGNRKDGDALLDIWLKKHIPLPIKQQIDDIRLQGYLWTWDWPEIISTYETIKESGRLIPGRLRLYASRAYSESGRFEEAIQCLNELKDPKSINEIHSLAITLLIFYCANGAKDKAEELLGLIDEYKYDLPHYIRDCWLGRLALAQNDFSKAENYFASALTATAQLPSWQKRINNIRQNPDKLFLLDKKAVLSAETVLQRLKQLMSAQEFISPKSGYGAVTFIVGIILIIFFLTNSYSLFPNSITHFIEFGCYNNGILIPANVAAGEYWRLFTFLFLHAHLMHVILNIVALFWLGKIVEKIYGLNNFLIIYFISGIMSGVVSMTFSPELAAIGASGAIMGIFGAVGTGIFRLKNNLPDSIRRKQLTIMISLLIFQLIIDQIIPHIDIGAHLGGLITGIFLGMILPIPWNKQRLATC